MKKFFLIILFISVMFNACSTNDDEPQINFTVNITTSEIDTVEADNASLYYSVSAANVHLLKIGVSLYKDDEPIQQYYSTSLLSDGEIIIDNLEPKTSYTYKAFVEYINPNTNDKEMKYGYSKKFTTAEKCIKIETPHVNSWFKNPIPTFTKGDCSIYISSNFSRLGKIILEVSTDINFEEIIFSKSLTALSSYEEIKFYMGRQGKYYCRIIGDYEEKIISNIGVLRIITGRGNIIEEGFVDLGLDTSWAATFYFGNDGKIKYPVATVSTLEGILGEGDNFSGTEYDYLTLLAGSPNRLPTREEIYTLQNACLWEIDGESYIISGCTGNALRLKIKELNKYDLFGSDCIVTSTLSTPSGRFIWGYNFNKNNYSSLREWPYYNISSTGYLLWPVKNNENK